MRISVHEFPTDVIWFFEIAWAMSKLKYVPILYERSYISLTYKTLSHMKIVYDVSIGWAHIFIIKRPIWKILHISLPPKTLSRVKLYMMFQ